MTQRVSPAWSRVRNGPSQAGAICPSLPASPALQKPLPRDAVAVAVSPMRMLSPHKVTAGHATPCPHCCQPPKKGGKCRTQHYFSEKIVLFQHRGAVKESSPGESSCLSLGLPALGEVWGPKFWESIMHRPQLRFWSQSSACIGCPPGHTVGCHCHHWSWHWDSCGGWGRRDSRTPVGAGSSRCGCPAAPLAVLRHLQNTGAGTGPVWPVGEVPGRGGLGCQGDGGLDKDNVWPHRVGTPTAPATSFCPWAQGDGGTRGSCPCG